MFFQAEPYWSALDWAEENHYPNNLYFDFNDDLDGTWYEGVAHMAAAFRARGDEEKAVALFDILKNAQTSSLNGDGQGIPGADIYSLTTGFSWNYYDRLSLQTTC